MRSYTSNRAGRTILLQVLSGILPISRVSVVPLCIHFVARLLPLERILSLQYPSEPSPPPPEDKRTWRGGMRVHAPVEQTTDPTWTAMDILIAYASKKGWVTAQVGRPDVYRAGNASTVPWLNSNQSYVGFPAYTISLCIAVLRALAENRVRWAFWPPGTDEQTIPARHDARDPTEDENGPHGGRVPERRHGHGGGQIGARGSRAIQRHSHGQLHDHVPRRGAYHGDEEQPADPRQRQPDFLC